MNDHERIFVPPSGLVRMTVCIKGLTELIMDRFWNAEEALGEKKKVTVSIEERWENSIYRDQHDQIAVAGFAIRQSLVEGSRIVKSNKMTELGILVTVLDEWCPLWGEDEHFPPEWRGRADQGKLKKTGAAIMIYRAGFPLPWGTRFTVMWKESKWSVSDMLDLIQSGGGQCGLYAWRGGNKGWAGKYTIDTRKEIRLERDDN